MKLLTIGDFFRRRYGVPVEILCSVMIILSYLGWVAAQVTALGLVFNILSGEAISHEVGMVIGTVLVLVYVMMGGMLAVAWTDFIQMIVLVLGLSYIAWYSADLVGGAPKVIQYAQDRDWFRILPEPNLLDWLLFLAAAITMMLGSIPQQDVFQRVMSAKDEKSAKYGAVIGGLCYLVFAFVPMFVVVAALIKMPEHSQELLKEPQKVLPRMILDHMPFFAQILFFGALVSAIKSCSSATLLAPSTSFVENILRHINPNLRDKQLLLAMRITILVFTSLVLTYAILTKGTPIYDLVSSAYQITLAGAFVPLTAGLYWKRATTQGAICSIAFGIGAWFLVAFAEVLQIPGMADVNPKLAPLVALVFAITGMISGSYAPQFIRNRCHILMEHLGLSPVYSHSDHAG
jgi:Na+/proline symporter